jgi:hypothetical protein
MEQVDMKCEICSKDADGGRVGGHSICFDCYISDDLEVINKLLKIMEELNT